jgi:acetyl esterase/lipase
MRLRTPVYLAVVALALAAPASSTALNGFKVTPDVVYGHKDGMALTFDVFRPETGANGAGVLFMVSGGWVSRWSPPETAVARFRALLDKGFTVFSVRHGSAPRYNVPEAVEDVRRAVRYIRLHAAELGVDAGRLGVFGGSAGGHLSLVLGTESDEGDPAAKDEVLRVGDRVAAVVAYFPPVDLRESNRIVLAGGDAAKRLEAFKAPLSFDPKYGEAVSPLLHVTSDDAPTLLVHGDKDTLVNVNASITIHKAFQEAKVPTDLIILPGAGHGFQGADAERAMAALVGWFEKHLSAKK